MYHIAQKFDGGKVWRIWQMVGNLSPTNLFLLPYETYSQFCSSRFVYFPFIRLSSFSICAIQCSLRWGYNPLGSLNPSLGYEAWLQGLKQQYILLGFSKIIVNLADCCNGDNSSIRIYWQYYKQLGTEENWNCRSVCHSMYIAF